MADFANGLATDAQFFRMLFLNPWITLEVVMGL